MGASKPQAPRLRHNGITSKKDGKSIPNWLLFALIVMGGKALRENDQACNPL
ncbi:hypothetical protein CAter282_1289 [Collimonas arenae]|uniref:Uncharacterized protein n=1 Tax=Collimonas arenae TaxID=279058 RepID=A0A127QG97_9BURK|nr:hypothetical protein CAter10_1384 [Collimonas arenae]AMP09080.1 hypothetical protein CAter282_1289 [Collimonas arenae]